jgi:hypothetical protein
LTATCDLFCFLLTGVFFFGADLVSDFCLSTSLVLLNGGLNWAIYKKSNPDDHVDDGQPEVTANCTQDSEHAESQLEIPSRSTEVN